MNIPPIDKIAQLLISFGMEESDAYFIADKIAWDYVFLRRHEDWYGSNGTIIPSILSKYDLTRALSDTEWDNIKHKNDDRFNCFYFTEKFIQWIEMIML